MMCSCSSRPHTLSSRPLTLTTTVMWEVAGELKTYRDRQPAERWPRSFRPTPEVTEELKAYTDSVEISLRPHTPVP